MVKHILILALILTTSVTYSQDNNSDSNYYLERAKNNYAKGDKESVFKDLKQAIKYSIDNKSDLYIILGDTYSEFKIFDKAIDSYNKAISLGHNLDYHILFNIGSAYYFSQKYENAIKYLEMALKFDGNHSGSANNLAWCYSEIENYPKAVKYFEIAYKQDPDLINNINNLGYAYYLNDELVKAEEYVLKAMKIDSDNSFVYRNLGLIYLKRSDKKKSCEYYQLALKHNIIERWGEIYTKELKEYCNQ